MCKKEQEEEEGEEKKVHCVHTRKLTPQACMHIGSSNRVPTLDLILQTPSEKKEIAITISSNLRLLSGYAS
jgi:hypothetical protein